MNSLLLGPTIMNSLLLGPSLIMQIRDQYFPKGKMKLIISNGKAELAHYGYKSDFKAEFSSRELIIKE